MARTGHPPQPQSAKLPHRDSKFKQTHLFTRNYLTVAVNFAMCRHKPEAPDLRGFAMDRFNPNRAGQVSVRKNGHI